MFRLFTSYYNDSNKKRAQEVHDTLKQNLESDVFSNICIFLENAEAPINDSRITYRQIESRPTYDDYFSWQRETCSGPSEISVIANSDIYFDKTLLALKQDGGAETCYALSRWNLTADERYELYDHNDSQDCWIFHGKIKTSVNGSFPLGVPRCDNRILYELRQAGYNVRNPAFNILSYHLHAGHRTPYGENESHFVDPPYNYLWPHNLWPITKIIAYNRSIADGQLPWRFDQRKFAATLPVRAIRKLGLVVSGKASQAQ